MIAAIVVAVFATTAAADDRDFLRERAAKPNILILLDTSTSMIGTSEVADEFTLGDGASNADFGMLPGAGDDPRSRMGIAKTVLRNFLQGATDANFALAGYQYELPKESGAVVNPYPAKHWTYQATASDRFGFLEQGYAYRIGWAQRTFNDPVAARAHTNPADYSKSMLFGYNPYFNPDDAGPGYVEPYNRYGPILAPEFNSGNSYSLLPIYLMRNCETEDIAADAVRDCGLRVFPFFTSLNRDGSTRQHTWTSSFEHCTPGAGAGGTDDGCRGSWTVDNGTSPATITQWVRQAHLEVPTDVSGDANHPIGEDTTGAMSGNQVVADAGADDYDLVGGSDPDYDGSETDDWLMRVQLVEQRRARVCNVPFPSPTPTATPTITDTPTPTPTATPTPTPTPIPPVCGDIEVGPLYYLDDYRVRIDVVRNNNPLFQLVHKSTVVEWEDVLRSGAVPELHELQQLHGQLLQRRRLRPRHRRHRRRGLRPGRPDHAHHPVGRHQQPRRVHCRHDNRHLGIRVSVQRSDLHRTCVRQPGPADPDPDPDLDSDTGAGGLLPTSP